MGCKRGEEREFMKTKPTGLCKSCFERIMIGIGKNSSRGLVNDRLLCWLLGWHSVKSVSF